MLLLKSVSSVCDYFLLLDCFLLCPEDVLNDWYKFILVWTLVDLDTGVVMTCCGSVVGCAVSPGSLISLSSSSVSWFRLVFVLFLAAVLTVDGVAWWRSGLCDVSLIGDSECDVLDESDSLKSPL